MKFFLGWFVVYEYYCSETTTAQASLGYVSLGHSRAAKHTRRVGKGPPKQLFTVYHTIYMTLVRATRNSCPLFA